MSEERERIAAHLISLNTPITRCGLQWADGWAAEHVCSRPKDHDGEHRCDCDGRISRWMLEYGNLVEDEEEDRQRLREELRAVQADPS